MNECTRNPQATSQFISLLQDCKAAWLQQRVYANVLKKTRLRMRVKSLLPEPTKYLIQFSGPVKTFCRLMKIFSGFIFGSVGTALFISKADQSTGSPITRPRSNRTCSPKPNSRHPSGSGLRQASKVRFEPKEALDEYYVRWFASVNLRSSARP